MVGIIASETDRIQLDPINTQNLFQQIEKNSTYSLEYPLNISAHRKRKLLPAQEVSSAGGNKTVEVGEEKLKTASKEYLPREKLKEDKRKLEVYIQKPYSRFMLLGLLFCTDPKTSFAYRSWGRQYCTLDARRVP